MNSSWTCLRQPLVTPQPHNPGVRISARTDYAIRAAVEIASRWDGGQLVKADAVAESQSIPAPFLLAILSELRRSGIVDSRRGHDGGYRLARPPSEITVADVIRAIDGPLANVAGVRPEALELTGSAVAMKEVWVCLRSSIRTVLERVTLADVYLGTIPEDVAALGRPEDAWRPR